MEAWHVLTGPLRGLGGQWYGPSTSTTPAGSDVNINVSPPVQPATTPPPRQRWSQQPVYSAAVEAVGSGGTRFAFQPRLEKGEQHEMLLTLLVIVLLLALLGGGYGSTRGWGYYGWSPLGLLILIVLILALTGNLNF